MWAPSALVCWLNPGQELDQMEEHVKSGEGSWLSPEEPHI